MIKILIVDDKEENIYLLESILNMDGFTTVCATNGSEALKSARATPPDLIISDILMPVMDGYTFCRECKKDENLKNIPFVFYTATYTNPKDEELAMHLGAVKYILKPQEPDVFLAIINEILEEMKQDKIVSGKVETMPEEIVLKEYNEALIRKIEDKMLQAEKAEIELRKYSVELENEIADRKKIEESLRLSEERFRSFYNEAVVGLYRISSNGEIVLANNALVAMLGFASFDDLGKRNLTKDGFEEPEKRELFLRQVEALGEVKSYECKWIRNDGTAVFVRESTKAIRDSNGITMFFDGVVEDITARKKAEDELQESRQLFETLAQVSPVGIFKTLPDGSTAYVNPRWCELSGLAYDAALGNGWMKAVHPDDTDKVNNNWQLNVENCNQSTAEYRFQRPDGSIVWVIGNAVPEIVDNEIRGYVGTITDVTEMKLYEQKLRTFSWAVEQSPVLITLTDVSGNIQYVNPKFEDVTGYKLAEVLNQNPRILKSGETSVDEYKKLWDALLRCEPWMGEFHNKRKNGELYWEHAVISPIVDKNGIVTHYMSVSEDVTHRKTAEHELILAKEKAEEMNRLKSNLLANMSHELRTPLIAILGYSELMQEEDTSPGIKNMAKSIHRGGNRLLSTLNNLLQFSKIESENLKPNLSKIDVNQSLREVLATLSFSIKAKGLELIVDLTDGPIYGNFDKMFLKEIFVNLLQNAVKFTDKGHIKVSASTADYDIIIKISDTGIGIPDGHQQQIFEEFRQVSEGLNRAYEGTGLGLTITKRFTNLLGGEIWVESKMDVGTVFTVKFPKPNEDIFRIEPGLTTGNNTETHPMPKLLYVENDSISVSVVSRFLKGFCDVESVADGEKAMQKIIAQTYDLFLMDINLGSGMTGIQITKFIKGLPQYKDTPVIALTAYAMLGDREEFLAAGCTHYITKPFKKNDLIELIKIALAR